MRVTSRGLSAMPRSRARLTAWHARRSRICILRAQSSLIELDQRFQFPQMMSVAQGMQHALHRVVGLPVVMHHDADDAGQEAAAVGADPIKSEKSSRGDVQPLGLAAETK